MPTKPISEGAYDARHRPERKPWENNRHREKRVITGRKLQRIRKRGLRKHPLCQICNIRPSMFRDHIIPISEDGEDNESNVQYLCGICHDEKSKRERNRK